LIENYEQIKGILNIFIVLIIAAFSISCTGASVGLIYLFSRYFNKENKTGGLIAGYSFGIYVLHYSIVTVFQYYMLKVDLPGLVKGLIVAAATLVTTLGLSYLIGIIPIAGVTVGKQYRGRHKLILIIITCILLLFIVIRNII
jgi:hypothetical protein